MIFQKKRGGRYVKAQEKWKKLKGEESFVLRQITLSRIRKLAQQENKKIYRR